MTPRSMTLNLVPHLQLFFMGFSFVALPAFLVVELLLLKKTLPRCLIPPIETMQFSPAISAYL